MGPRDRVIDESVDIPAERETFEGDIDMLGGRYR